jgi:hypothetical protein
MSIRHNVHNINVDGAEAAIRESMDNVNVLRLSFAAYTKSLSAQFTSRSISFLVGQPPSSSSGFFVAMSSEPFRR